MNPTEFEVRSLDQLIKWNEAHAELELPESIFIADEKKLEFGPMEAPNKIRIPKPASSDRSAVSGTLDRRIPDHSTAPPKGHS